MATVTPTPTPAQKKKGRKSKHDASIPFFDGSYYLLVTQMVDGVRKETGVGRLREATRGLTAIGSHTKRRFSALSLLGKLVTSILLVGLGAALASGAWFHFARRDAGTLRREARAHLDRGELIEARRDLEALRLAPGGLTPTDRAALAEPLRARFEAQARRLRAQVEGQARAGQRDKALATLDELDTLEVDQRWALFTRAEILRGAHRAEAGATYERFVSLYPESEQADDALYWQALLAKEAGRTAEARGLCEKLLWKYPKSNFRTASDRMLADLNAPVAK